MRLSHSFGIALLSLAGLTAAQAATNTPRVDARQAQQQARIASGVADGSLTRPEARQLQHQQRHIRQAERRAKADGVVTARERQHLARLQQQASRSIHRQKHDAQVRPQRAG
jgi:hypothetical protein